MGNLYPALDITGMDGELLLAVVDDFSPTAVEEKDSSLTVFFSTPHARDCAREAILREQPQALIVSRDVDDEDWARRSQQNLGPVTVGRIIVTPPWSVTQPLTSNLQPRTAVPHSLIPNPQSLVVVINPSMGFGTGHHPSTRLCLAAMQRLDLTGAFVLDVGAGSGVLAIAARRLGARAALGIDTDPDAIQSAHENLQLNPGVTKVRFTAGDLTTWLGSVNGDGTPDVITANLTGALLVRSAGLLTGALKPGGHLILSGVMQSERAEVSAAFAARTEVLSITSEEEWVGLLLKKAPGRTL